MKPTATRFVFSCFRVFVFSWITLGASPASADSVTYSKDIAALLQDRCAMCHHAGGSAPFPLVTYADAKRHAAQIAAVTRARFMPPWKADPSNGPFVGQHPLTAAEIALLQQWVADGAPEGDARQLPPARAWTEGWQLGAPDLVVSLPEPYTLGAEGSDVFRIFVMPIPIDRLRFVRGLEFRPGNPRVVHHANIRVDETAASRRLDDADAEPGYEGVIARSAVYPDGHFLGWTPGQISPLLPSDLAWRLAPTTDLVVELHMQPTGKPETVAPAVALYFGGDVPARTPAMLRLGRQNIDIPPGDTRYTITDAYTLPVDVELEALQPHAHQRARDVRGFATLPDGTVKPLITIVDWDFRWQHVYRFVQPIALPKGTTLSMRYSYDNSPANPRNPVQPPVRIRWGQRSTDEMGDLWFQVLTRDQRDLETLSGEFRAKAAAEDVLGYEVEIEKHPLDADLHDSVALLYLELHRVQKAIDHFRASARLKPASAQAWYNLGTALTVARQLDAAAAAFAAALRLDPTYANAHNNLGNVLLALGRTADAIQEFFEVTQLEPRSAAALRNLAAAYAFDHQFARAIDAIDAALRLNPAEPAAGELRRQRADYLQRSR